jgi:hypothetical protein
MATSDNDNEVGKQHQIFSVTYQSPDNAAFTYTQKLPTPPTVETSYLSALRKAAAKMQEQINKELTARMEEDKARDAEGTKPKVVDDAKEEDNYGEEIVEEE